jgi:DNA topoisomerase-1
MARTKSTATAATSLKDSKILIIVESPNKVKTISNILKTEGYKHASVVASVGHVMELGHGGPAFNSGIYPAENFKMNLQVSEDKKKVVENLKAQIKVAERIFLMTDADREGEVIAWSLVQFCKIPKTKYCRVTTHEITPKAVAKALESPRALDMNLVNAGLSRMMIDKLIGFGLSPMGKKYVGAKSIGRCQSVGLKMAADRENEIINFVPEKYYNLYLNFEKNSVKFRAKYIGTDKIPIDHFKNKNEVDTVKYMCKNGKYTVSQILKKEKLENPKPPFCTATYQQEAANKLGLKVKDAMSCAQKLFEGINMNGKHIGLISYMRTDSTELAPEFLPDLKKYIEGTYGKGFYNAPRKAKKSEQDQDGHEALRVTDVNITPDVLANYVANDLLLKVYKLIWQRTVASAMPAAKISETTYIINNNEHMFSLVSNELTFAGYKEVYNYVDSSDEEAPIKETFKEGEKLAKTSLEDVLKTTSPKPRYTEAALIKELQKQGIGRPSTYATIVETILSPTRGYSNLEDKHIVPTDRGMQLAAYCDRAFSDIINLNYTKELEKSLDLIATGQLDWLTYMNKFFNDLKTTIGANTETGITAEGTDKVCPNCGAPMVVRRSRFGKLFYGCSKYPKCTGIVNFE